VQISKRGVYAPGTTNRLITIKGSQVSAPPPPPPLLLLHLLLFLLILLLILLILLLILLILLLLVLLILLLIPQRACKSALYLVQQKIQEKQEERARSGRS